MRIAVVAPSNPVSRDVPPRVLALAAALYLDGPPDIVFHPQCFLSDGHFAGPDAAREDALVEVANDPAVDAIWFGRGGYGANRIAERAVARMTGAARTKYFLGYSDAGFVLATLMARGVGRPVHAPMPSDIMRPGGEEAIARVLAWLADPVAAIPQVAFNLTVMASLVGTPLQPDLTGRVLMIEEVDEPLYRIDRAMFQITSNRDVRQCAGIMLGRCAPITPNLPAFGMDVTAIARHWCTVSNIAWLGSADIGHDAQNAIVPFG